ncbi:class I SAM-dependent methyltransferase [Methylobrevis pamukkalensis]|uniref:Ribosomal protein L11 methyltransferase n=1 Tax=Methylobrevis pamukkalensis TaxID=1439726 RepID=A0A1E3H249_9HYPH|nr:methyltransferase [Methylobrevis pamukkalensis]ODN70409.1 ribosomal protein L11 methyltransferase [Methylobrevis pamukkalensis]
MPGQSVDPRSFIRANTRLFAPPHVPELRLHLADEAMDLWSRTEEELGELGLPPPFWAFAWAGGQALARHILDNPDLVAGKRVLDFASGSGLVAIATMKAGAASVVASEIDRFAFAAIALNAEANGVTVAIDSRDLTDPAFRSGLAAFDVVLAGDVFYEKPMADRVLPLLREAEGAGAAVLFGDPGRSYLPKGEIVEVATYTVPVTRAIEDSEVKRTSVWRLVARETADGTAAGQIARPGG